MIDRGIGSTGRPADSKSASASSNLAAPANTSPSSSGLGLLVLDQKTPVRIRLETPIKVSMSHFIELAPNSFLLQRDGAIAPELCQKIIAKFDSDPRSGPGTVQRGTLRPDVKESTDLFITACDDWKELDNALHQSLLESNAEFAKHFDFLTFLDKDTGYNIQRTKVGQLGYLWHSDVYRVETDRQYAVIWYLNDVLEGGETEFKYQDVRVKPKQGRMLLFPPYWTHVHRGCAPISNDKYIVTTWLNFRHR